MIRWLILGFLVITLTSLALAPDASANRTKRQYATSQQPYWRGGQLDPALSKACRKGEFGQRKMKLLTIGFIGGQGRAQTGIAKTGWNLVDPNRLAQPKTTYHFFNQGFSNCKVYKARDPRSR